MGDWLAQNWGWLVLGVILFGGSIGAFFSRVGDILMAHAGRGKKLGRGERREMERLRIENGRLRETLREVQAYDKFAVSPLPTELSEKVNGTLRPKEIER